MITRSGLFLIITCGLLMSCENDLKDIQAIDRGTDNVLRYEDIHMTYSDSSKIRVLLEAPIMETHFDEANKSVDRFPQGLFVTFYDEQGIKTSELRAKDAVGHTSKDLVTVRDSVALVSVDGDTMRTEELHWNSKTGEIYTTGAFRYANPTERIFGYKFKSDQNFERFTYDKMSGQLQSALKPSEIKDPE